MSRAAATVETATDIEAELLAKVSRPKEVKGILREMTTHQLPARMDLSYMRLVVAILTGLDVQS